MKKMSLVFLLMTFGFSAFASNDKVCEALMTKMDMDCNHFVCDDEIANGVFTDMNDCTTASDFGEYAQAACEEQPTLQDLVKEYNKKHPRNKVSCKE